MTDKQVTDQEKPEEIAELSVLGDDNPFSEIMMNTAMLDQAQAMAEKMAEATVTIPAHLQKKPGDCYAITLQALQWRLNPFVVAQKTHIVNGHLGYEAQLVIAVLQSSGAIKGSFKYEYRGEGVALECRAGAVIAGETEITWGEWLADAAVKTKNSPLWKTNPKQQLAYLQAKNWARIYCPGAILGVYTPDEFEDKDNPASDVRTPNPIKGNLYSAEDFERNYPSWKGRIQNGSAKAESVISHLLGMYEFTEEQKTQIDALRNFEPIEGQTANG